MAMTHALGHWTGTASPAASAQDGNPAGQKRLAHQNGCSHCSAFAQLGFALGTHWNTHFGIDATYALDALPSTPAACLRTVCHFDSRAPPQALTS